ncbi:glycosyltransferase family 4 protein [Cellulomonas marina]|nr:glycosyltransferase family 4 protein [Cellulomonas marina]
MPVRPHSPTAVRRRGSKGKIAFLTHSAKLSGAEIALANIVPWLTNDVDVVVMLGEDGPLADALRVRGVDVIIVDSLRALSQLRREGGFVSVLQSSSGIVRMVWRHAVLFRRLRVDVVETGSMKSHVYGGIAAILVGRPLILRLHDRVDERYFARVFARTMRFWCAVVPDLVVANSQSSASTLLPSTRVRVVPPAVPAVGVGQRVDGIDHDLHFGCIGRIAPWKGQAELIEAFAGAFRGGGERLVICGAPLFGEDAYFESIKLLAVELGVADQVQFLGFVQDVGSVLGSLDVLVHSSILPEPFGQVVIEGMSAGLAVVAADSGGPAENIEHGVNGLLYATGNVEELRRCLELVASADDLRTRIGAAGPLQAARFQPEAVVPTLLDCYRLVQGTRGSLRVLRRLSRTLIASFRPLRR